MDKQQLTLYGINYDKGLKNCVGNKEFYYKILRMFMQDTTFKRASEFYKIGDYKNLFFCAHELKGMSGNTAFDELYAAVVCLVELLRGDLYKTAKKEDVDTAFAAVQNAYNLVVMGITHLLDEQG